MGFEAEDEEASSDPAIALQDLQKVMRESQEHLVRGIVRAREVDGLGYRQIGAILGVAHSRVFHIYKKAKKRGW